MSYSHGPIILSFGKINLNYYQLKRDLINQKEIWKINTAPSPPVFSHFTSLHHSQPLYLLPHC